MFVLFVFFTILQTLVLISFTNLLMCSVRGFFVLCFRAVNVDLICNNNWISVCPYELLLDFFNALKPWEQNYDVITCKLKKITAQKSRYDLCKRD